MEANRDQVTSRVNQHLKRSEARKRKIIAFTLIDFSAMFTNLEIGVRDVDFRHSFIELGRRNIIRFRVNKQLTSH